MLDFFSRRRLERKGLSSGAQRRKIRETELRKALHQGAVAKAALFGVFAACTLPLLLLGRDTEAVFADSPMRTLLVTLVVVLTMAIQFYVHHTRSFTWNNRVGLTLGMIFIQLLSIHAGSSAVRAGVFPDNFRYLLPAFAAAPVILTVMLGRNHGIYAAIYASLLGAMLVPRDMAFTFMVMGLLSGFVGVYFSHPIRRRGRMVQAGFFVGLATAGIALVTGVIALEPFTWKSLGIQVLTPVVVSTAAAMLISGALPVLEALFRITTEISWIEMADLNHPLLKRLSNEASGTFHHSLEVARLAEAAAEAIGANAALCRVASLYHDVGKLKKPQYFIENVKLEEESNPHNELTPTMSALIITAHVKEGVDLALKYNLHEEIIDAIREHHGTTIVQYFYHRALDQRRRIEKLVEEGKANAEDLPVVEEKGFRYPGPKPRSRESAIISLADGIASAARTLQKTSAAKLELLIEEFTQKRFEDGQLSDSELTLADLTRIQKSFQATLYSMHHNRIAYPGGSRLGQIEPAPASGEKERKESAAKLEVVTASSDPRRKSA